MTTTLLTGISGLGACTSTGAATLVTGTTVFTITGGPIRITDLCSLCVTANDATASTLRWSADGDAAGQTATTITGISGALTSFAAGGFVYCDFTTLATAPVITATTGVYLFGPTAATGGGVVVPAGIITTTVATGPTTGTWKHYLRWLPLADSVSVTAAF
jgi:hypothetical protein